MLQCISGFDLSLYHTGSLIFLRVESFICGGENLLTLVFLLLFLPSAPVALKQHEQMELLLHHLGLQPV